MKKNEKELKKSSEELSEDFLGNVAGGYTISGKGDVWVVHGITQDNMLFNKTATSLQEAYDIAEKEQLKTGLSNGLKGVKLQCSPTSNGFSTFNW